MVDDVDDLGGSDSPAAGEFVTVSLTLPRARVPELMSFAATLWSESGTFMVTREVPRVRGGYARSEDRVGVAREALQAAGPGLTPEAIREAYRGGTSTTWRPFLKLLAHQPDRWVPWPALYGALGLTDRQCAGMLGAAERRCKGFPPYVKSTEGESHFFYMPAFAARIVNDMAARQ